MNTRTPLRTLVAAALAVLVQAAVAATSGPAVVGEASLVIGVARLLGADGSVRPVARGDAVREGDRIETEAGGHVHLRFIDGGRLAVRPSSRLLIENYSQTAAPEQGAIRFRLDEGVVRSITGAWGEAARERFRLNTPVAAIGVKGTDFIAAADADKTLATVYTGAIVLAPLQGCAAALGPCTSGAGKLLSESMKGQMVALYSRDALPQIVALGDTAPVRPGADAPGRSTAQADKPLAAPATTTTAAATATQADTVPDKTVRNEALVAIVTGRQAATPEPPAPQPPNPPTPPTPPEPQPAPKVSQLAWGRLPWTLALNADTLSQALADASANGRSGLLGNGAFSLYREGGSSARLATTEASAQFRLAGGSARLVMAGGRTTEAVAVGGGTLGVDFARGTFETRLQLSSPTLGSDSVQANGQVRPNGLMFSQGGNAYMAGALSLDGKEAGYYFDRNIPAGNLNGITTWGR